MIDFDLNEIDDNAFHTTDFADKNIRTLSMKEVFQFCKANKVFKEPGISANELRALHDACEKVLGDRQVFIVETGMCYGVTNRYFVWRKLRYGGRLTTFEFKVREGYMQAMKDLGLWKEVDVRGHSMKDPYHGEINLLWIDSEHALEDALGEYMRFRVWLSPGSLVGFHDTDVCPGVRKALEIIQEVDELELVDESTDVHGAGCKLYKVIKTNRSDRPWNTRMRD